jgi:hypothetical protein
VPVPNTISAAKSFGSMGNSFVPLALMPRIAQRSRIAVSRLRAPNNRPCLLRYRDRTARGRVSVDRPVRAHFAILLALFCAAHGIAAKLGWAPSQTTEGGRRRLPFAPSVAAALIGTIILRSPVEA